MNNHFPSITFNRTEWRLSKHAAGSLYMPNITCCTAEEGKLVTLCNSSLQIFLNKYRFPQQARVKTVPNNLHKQSTLILYEVKETHPKIRNASWCNTLSEHHSPIITCDKVESSLPHKPLRCRTARQCHTGIEEWLTEYHKVVPVTCPLKIITYLTSRAIHRSQDCPKQVTQTAIR